MKIKFFITILLAVIGLSLNAQIKNDTINEKKMGNIIEESHGIRLAAYKLTKVEHRKMEKEIEEPERYMEQKNK